MHGRALRLVLFGALAAVVFSIYAPVAGGKPFGDDWVYVMDQPARHIGRALFELHPYHFYRPIPLAVTSGLQLAGHGSPVPIHVCNFLVHALLAVVVAGLAVRLGISNGGAV
ncbi:MAG TPA: hypothetical protein VFH88_00745, partial [Candidatus Krumholzibacteria bacterium]|nr:hypothetical protein [Candidatus Krumholzibacteria bacterium]